MKKKLEQLVSEIYPSLVPLSDQIYDRPELSHKEHFASKLLCDWLETNGYNVERGVSGVETAFRAIWRQGEGGPSIGFLVEYDALPMGHACGHHMQGAIMFAAAEALKRCEIKNPFQIVIYGTPDEENLSGKPLMQKRGCFQDIDVALMTHGSSYTTVDIKSLTTTRIKVRYTGIAAHESMTPEKSRSGLDALMLAYHGLQAFRGRIKSNVVLSYDINNCRGMPNNKDHTAAEGTVSIRSYDYWDMAEMEKRLVRLFEGAAMMADTDVHIDIEHRTEAKVPSYSLNKIIMDNAALIKAPHILKYREKTGVTDFACVTHMMPAAVSRYPFVPIGTASHSEGMLKNGKGESAVKGIELGAKLIALSAYDLISNPELLEECVREYKIRKAEYDQNVINGCSKEQSL